jgi:hypothetical protein
VPTGQFRITRSIARTSLPIFVYQFARYELVHLALCGAHRAALPTQGAVLKKGWPEMANQEALMRFFREKVSNLHWRDITDLIPIGDRQNSDLQKANQIPEVLWDELKKVVTTRAILGSDVEWPGDVSAKFENIHTVAKTYREHLAVQQDFILKAIFEILRAFG